MQRSTHIVKIVSRVLKTVAIVMHREGETFVCCLLEKNEERDEKVHVRTVGCPQTGAQWWGRTRGGTKDPSPAWSEQHRRRDVGTGVGLPNSTLLPILDTGKILFQIVFGDRDVKVHRCTEPSAGKEF